MVSEMHAIDRRSFLKYSLATGATALTPAARVLGANDDLRVAVVGFRGHGQTHLRNYLKMPGVGERFSLDNAGQTPDTQIVFCDFPSARHDRTPNPLKRCGDAKL